MLGEDMGVGGTGEAEPHRFRRHLNLRGTARCQRATSSGLRCTFHVRMRSHPTAVIMMVTLLVWTVLDFHRRGNDGGAGDCCQPRPTTILLMTCAHDASWDGAAHWG
jgi:hypothetical protein